MYREQDKKLLAEFANASDQLLEMGVISTDSFTGEIGEFYACNAYDLEKSDRVNKGFDGTCKSGKRYQVKAKIYKGTFNYTISKLRRDYFEYLVVVFFDEHYVPEKIVRIPADKIDSEKFRISNSNIDKFEVFDLRKLRIPRKTTEKITHFADLYNALVQRKIIRSRRIVGDIGEFYAAKKLDLILEENKNAKGLDAKDKKGNTYEIKTRRVYDSDRRISNTRRINGLVGKTATFLIIVTLDRKFECSGMWIMPTKNIYNPKSAKLEIVNTTPGVRNIVPSQIPYLLSGEPYKSTGAKPVRKKRTKSETKTPSEDLNIPPNKKKKAVRKKDTEKVVFTREEKIVAVVILVLLALLVLKGI